MSPTPRAPARVGLVTFDLDGTLTTVHGWRFLAESTGRLAEFELTNRRFFAGELSEDEHLRNLLDLAVGLHRSQVDEILARTPRVDGIGETLDGLRVRGIRSALLTHNPTYVCDWYLRHYPFDAAEGTPGTIFDGDRIVDSGPAKAEKLEGLVRLSERFGTPLNTIVHVGDGRADAAVFARVGGGIAFNTRLPDVAARADASLTSPTLTSILAVLDGWRSPPPA